ncbi:MAG: GWxTD domain-containing protein, partial [Gemmatimonadales bacterium]
STRLRPPRRAALLAALALLAPVPLASQEPADRIALLAFRDSIATNADSLGLLRLEQRMIEVAKGDRNNPVQHLRLGLLAMRLGELSGTKHYEDAAGEFEWVNQLQPAWPYGWYGLGLAEDRIGDSQISIVAGLQAMLGKDHLTRAANAFAKSVQVDPAFVEGLVELASTALRQRINIKIDLAREALRQAAITSAGANPEVLLYRGRVEREVGDPDSALAAFQSYLERGGQRGIGLLEVARTQFVLGSLDGAAAYFEGATQGDSATIVTYRGDLTPIADDSILAEFDASPSPAYRVAFLKRFWAKRDLADMRHDGERLREHYRRLAYARRNFQLVSANRHYDIVERYRSGSRDFDDRGVIYIRHGEPTERATYSAPRLEANESWRYARADGDLIFHFVAREDVQDYKLVESVLDVLGFSTTVALRGDPNGNGASFAAGQLLLSREHFSPLYSRLLGTGTASAGAQRYVTEERRLGQRSIAIGTRSDSYELNFPRELKARARVVVVGRDSTASLMQVTYAIPGSALTAVSSSRGEVYPVRVRLSVVDDVGGRVAFLDTTRLFVSHDPVPTQEHLVGRVSVPVTPGRLYYRLSVQESEESGVVLPRDSAFADDFSGASFAVSDLVIGARSSNLLWRATEADTVFFNPVGVYLQNSTMELYYEVYGLAPGAEYRTQLAVTKRGGGKVLGLFGGRKASISLSFDDQADGPVIRSRRSLGLERLSRGVYWIDLTVTDPEGTKLRRRQAFEVRGEVVGGKQ